jgi:hypothetical protein
MLMIASNNASTTCAAITAASASDTRLELEVPGDQHIRMAFNSIGVVELL